MNTMPIALAVGFNLALASHGALAQPKGQVLSPDAPPQLQAGPKLNIFESPGPDGDGGNFTLYYALDGAHQVVGPEVDGDQIVTFPNPAYPPCTVRGGGGPETYDRHNAPDYVELTACYLEYTLYQFAQLGFNNGQYPTAINRVYFIEYDANGTSMPLNVPLLAGDIVINRDIDLARLPTLVAHEMFHQYQYTYTTSMVPFWILEGTATWSEDLIFDEHDQYQKHFNHYMYRYETSLKQSKYDASAFWRYLTEKVGPQDPEHELNIDFMLTLWDHLAAGHREESLNMALVDHQSPLTWQQIFMGDFALANALKGEIQALPAHQYLEHQTIQFDDITPINAENTALAPGESKVFEAQDVAPYSLHYYWIEGSTELDRIRLNSQADGGDFTIQSAAVYGPTRQLEYTLGDQRDGPWLIDAGNQFQGLYIVVAAGKRAGDFSLQIEGI